AADGQCDPVDITLATELIGAVLDILLLAPEAEGLPEEIALSAKPRIGRTALLRLAVGEAGQSQSGVQAETLRELGVEIELAAVPQPPAQKRGVGPGLPDHAAARQAVRALIGRAKARIALENEGGLRVDVPVPGLRRIRHRHCGKRRLAARGCVVDLVVEPELRDMELGTDVDCGRWRSVQAERLRAEVDVVVFELGAPMSVERDFDTRARSP